MCNIEILSNVSILSVTPYTKANNDLLSVNLYADNNIPSQSECDASELINCPPNINGTFIFQRYVRWMNKTNVLIEIIEFYPVIGRHWYNLYKGDKWAGWVCTTPVNPM